MILIFGTNNCKYCKIQKEYLKDFYDDEYKYIEVDKDEEILSLAENIKIENLPTVIILNKNGQEIFRKEGTMNVEQIKKVLDGNK